MQKELDKLSGITPKIQACIDGRIQNVSLELTNQYESRIAEVREKFHLTQVRRYLPQSKIFLPQACPFSNTESLTDTGPGIYHSKAFFDSYDGALMAGGGLVWRLLDKAIHFGV